MNQNNSSQLSGRLQASRAKLMAINPFSTRTAITLTIVLGMILSFSVAVGYLQWTAINQINWSQFLFVIAHNLGLAAVIFATNFKILGRCLRTTSVKEPATRSVLAAVGISLAFTLAYGILVRALRNIVFSQTHIGNLVEIGSINDLLLMAIAILVTLLIFALTRHQQILLENETLQGQQLNSRFEALERQIDPHFLFNSLNTLGGLIGVDDQKAQNYLHQLASAYRYIMRQREGHTVTLAEEMDFVDNYCSMMQIRYGSNLIIERHIAPQCLAMQIPAISVQLLVENAIKHNVVSERHPLTITIQSTPDNMLLVSNPLQPKQDTPQGASASHLGLANLSQRYTLLFHRDIAIHCNNGNFLVQLPLIQSKS